MTGNNEAPKSADLQVSERHASQYMLGRYGVREDGWQPFKGMSQAFYAFANTREHGRVHVLKVGGMERLILIATASGEAHYLDLNVMGDHLPYTPSDRQIYVDHISRFDNPQTYFKVDVRPENGHRAKGFDAELYWWEGGDQMVRLLVAPDFCAIIEWGRYPNSWDDPTPGKLTLSSLEALGQVRDAFPNLVPPNVEVWEDSRLTHFVCANTHTMSVGGVFRSW